MAYEVCEVKDCYNYVKSRKMCGNHYALWRRNGKPERISEKTNYGRVCTVDGCGSMHSSKGFCSKHYARFSKYGTTDLPPKKRKFECKVDGCIGDKHKAFGLCGHHYDAHRAGRSIETLPDRKTRRTGCSIDGCSGKHRVKGFCTKHYQRWKSHGDPMVTKNKRKSGNGKLWHSNPDGYIVRYEPTNLNSGPNGQVYQHRHVMSGTIGRPLKKTENVHHKNGDRSDNRPDNLELWSKGQPSGQRIQDKAAWCVDFLIEHMADASRLDDGFADRLSALSRALKS